MTIDFAKGAGLVPVIVQDVRSSKVLMLGYMNEAALAATRQSGQVTFFSRSRGELWTKGESSGNFLTVVEILSDCDQDTLLIKAIPAGPTCHSGTDTCFGESNQAGAAFLDYLATIIHDRRAADPQESYTAKLLSAGVDRCAQKVGEEAVEAVIAALRSNNAALAAESADLLYHLLVLLECRGNSWDEVIQVLRCRHK